MFDLDTFLRAHISGERGWKARLEDEYCSSIPDDCNKCARLAGHYSGLLDDVIKAVGAWRLLCLIDAQREIEKRLAELEKVRAGLQGKGS